MVKPPDPSPVMDACRAVAAGMHAARAALAVVLALGGPLFGQETLDAGKLGEADER